MQGNYVTVTRCDCLTGLPLPSSGAAVTWQDKWDDTAVIRFSLWDDSASTDSLNEWSALEMNDVRFCEGPGCSDRLPEGRWAVWGGSEPNNPSARLTQRTTAWVLLGSCYRPGSSGVQTPCQEELKGELIRGRFIIWCKDQARYYAAKSAWK